MIAVFLADGFEEIEALCVVDILRRADLPVKTVGVATDAPVGAHGIIVKADMPDSALVLDALDAVVLPGGMPGTTNLEKSDVVQRAISHALQRELPLGAICAAPSILGHIGALRGLKATCYPGFEEALQGATFVPGGVVRDRNITTAAGAGVAIDFALELVAQLASPACASSIRSAIQCL